MTAIASEHPSIIEPEWVLNALDRCDQCEAQAYVKVIGVTGDLLFCNHHYNKIMNNEVGYKKMMSFMYEVVDERERLVDNKAKGKDY
jgi:hypothetical protein